MEEDEEQEQNLITINIEGEEKRRPLLKDIQKRCEDFVNEIETGEKKTLEDYRKIIYDIETCSKLNYYFLKYLKDNNFFYDEDGIKWDYKKNFKALEKTLTCAQHQLLNKTKPRNPLNKIINILKEYIKIRVSEKKKSEKKKRNSIYKKFIKKNKQQFKQLNFPLIAGIERLRVNYYRDLILEKNISIICYDLRSYINVMHKDEEIFDKCLDSNSFNLKTYLFILTITKTFEDTNEVPIRDFFIKNINKTDEQNNYENIKSLKKGKYLVQTKSEKKEIDGKDYILSGLQKDISNNPYYPLKILLFRNESYQKFVKDGKKGFIFKLGLYDSFIEYIKFFIKSNVMQEILQNNECYHNIAILLNNDNYIDEMLSETHFRFLPFYGSDNFFGITNKDILVSFINSVPELARRIKIYKIIEDLVNIEEKEIMKNITNICLLLSIGVKFITSLHEFIIHLVYGYLHYISEKRLDCDSYKENDVKDGGFFFEQQLSGGKRFESLNINSVIVLLDSFYCQKNLADFQKNLNENTNIDELKQRIKEGKIGGFLKNFLDKYPINFDYFKERINELKISCRRISDIEIIMDRPESCVQIHS